MTIRSEFLRNIVASKIPREAPLSQIKRCNTLKFGLPRIDTLSPWQSTFVPDSVQNPSLSLVSPPGKSSRTLRITTSLANDVFEDAMPTPSFIARHLPTSFHSLEPWGSYKMRTQTILSFMSGLACLICLETGLAQAGRICLTDESAIPTLPTAPLHRYIKRQTDSKPVDVYFHITSTQRNKDKITDKTVNAQVPN